MGCSFTEMHWILNSALNRRFWEGFTKINEVSKITTEVTLSQTLRQMGLSEPLIWPFRKLKEVFVWGGKQAYN